MSSQNLASELSRACGPRPMEPRAHSGPEWLAAAAAETARIGLPESLAERVRLIGTQLDAHTAVGWPHGNDEKRWRRGRRKFVKATELIN
jgi:hypothetical protein